MSNYLLQSVFAVTLFYGFGFALFAHLERYQVALSAVLFGLLQIIGSLLWLHYFRLGPVEWLWRRLTGTDRQLLFDGAVPPPSGEVTHRV